jgi:hypothetical protein
MSLTPLCECVSKGSPVNPKSSSGALEGAQEICLQNLALWHAGYFKLGHLRTADAGKAFCPAKVRCKKKNFLFWKCIPLPGRGHALTSAYTNEPHSTNHTSISFPKYLPCYNLLSLEAQSLSFALSHPQHIYGFLLEWHRRSQILRFWLLFCDMPHKKY